MFCHAYVLAAATIHAGQEPDPSTGAIMRPIDQTSTYVQQRPGVHKGYDNVRDLQADLEEGLAKI
jgi:cystathionine beta-lyase/cystathionine gamma-synthase